MSIYKRFCREEFDDNGRLTNLTLDYPENFNFAYDVVDVIAEEEPDKRAIVWCNRAGDEKIITFGELKRLTNKAANAMKEAGIGRGDRVMISLKRHYEYWIVTVALHKLGAVMTPVTHMLTVDDIVYRLESTEFKAIICTPENDVAGRMKEAVAKTGQTPVLWSVQEDIEGFVNFSELMENAPEDFERVETLASDPIALYFTSGTTGYPKGVIHNNVYPLAHIVTAKYWHQAEDGGLHFTVAETGWAKTSWGKIYGQWLVGSAVMVFDFDNFDPKQLVNVINKYEVTTFCAPPTVYRYLVRKGMPKMPSVRHACTAGEVLHPEVFKKFTEATGLKLHEGYGQTETTLVTANFKGVEPIPGSMGVASPLYDVRLMKKDGTVAENGDVGEIVIIPKKEKTADGVFTGYLDNDELYSNVWENGVYHTGDAAWKDENGYFWFYGRFDDIIKTGGFRVGPYEVENVLIKHPAVVECAVIGVPDPLRGQSIKAVIVLGKGYEKTKELEKEIKDFTNSKLAEYKWIRTIEIMDEMPKTISGKIRKVDLKEDE